LPSKVKGTKSPNAASVVDFNAEFQRVGYGFATDKQSRIGGDQDHAARPGARTCRDDGGDSSDREFGFTGPTRSEGVEKFVDQIAHSRGIEQSHFEKEFFATVRPSSLLKRFASTDEVASLVIFLVSPLSSAINGTALRADGGVVRAIT
jgi:Enoyl-(Acyl carrier protein) reductase